MRFYLVLGLMSVSIYSAYTVNDFGTELAAFRRQQLDSPIPAGVHAHQQEIERQRFLSLQSRWKVMFARNVLSARAG